MAVDLQCLVLYCSAQRCTGRRRRKQIGRKFVVCIYLTHFTAQSLPSQTSLPVWPSMFFWHICGSYEWRRMLSSRRANKKVVARKTDRCKRRCKILPTMLLDYQIQRKGLWNKPFKDNILTTEVGFFKRIQSANPLGHLLPDFTAWELRHHPT